MKTFLWITRFLTYLATLPIAIIAIATLFVGGWFVAIIWACWVATITSLYNDFGAVSAARERGEVEKSNRHSVDWLLRATDTFNPNPSSRTAHHNGTQDFGLRNSDLGYNVPSTPVHRTGMICSGCSAAWPLPAPRRCLCCATDLNGIPQRLA